MAAAQEGDAGRDAGLDEVMRIFGATGRAVDAVEKLGGKVEYSGPVRRLVGVDLSGTKVADSDLAILVDRLKVLAEFRSLNLSNTGVTDAGLAHLRELTALARLNLACTRVTDPGVEQLFQALSKVMVSRRPRSLPYFPRGVIRSNGDELLADRYAEDLFAMKEPSLWSLSKEDCGAVAYRFFWVPSFRPSLAVRIVSSGDVATLHVVKLDGRRGYRGGKPEFRRSVALSHDQWVELKRRVEETRFWSSPRELWTPGIADGAGYLVEGVEGGKYHSVSANSNPQPDDRYRRFQALCDAIVELAGLENVDLW